MTDNPQNVSPEDSMVEPQIDQVQQVPSSSNDLEQYGGAVDVNNVFGQLSNINEDGILHEPTCEICSNPHREDMEQKWLENKEVREVKQLLKERGCESIKKSVIENHMFFHMSSEIKQTQMIEYTGRLARLDTVNMTTLDRIRLCLSALTERLMGINSITPGGDNGFTEIEKIKSAETAKLMSSFNQLLKLQASILGEMKVNGELIAIPTKKFVAIFEDAILNAGGEKEREAIQAVLAKLQELSITL